MTRRDLWLLGLLSALALALRLHGVTHPSQPWADEVAHVHAATHYWNDGQFLPDLWEHPPLRHLTMRGFTWLLGDGPLGWRMRNALFGTLAVALTYLLARRLGGGWRAALLAGLLLATDPLHVVLSRTTAEEVYGGALFLGAVVLLLSRGERPGRLVLAALLAGCALATKWYYVPGWLLLWPLLLRQELRARGAGAALFASCAWLLLPVGVYVAAYLPWFGRGYALPELLELAASAYRSLQAVTAESYLPGTLFLRHPSALAWFTRPILLGQGAELGGGRGEFLLLTNDWPVWVLVLPAMIGLATLAARRRSLELALPVLLFSASGALLLLVDRPVFLYSAAPLLPFAFVAIGLLAGEGADRLGGRLGGRLYAVALAALLGWCGYLYPLVTSREIPVAAYRWLLERGDISAP